jgi:hypothetical protein
MTLIAPTDLIFLGEVPNDKTGDDVRTALGKANGMAVILDGGKLDKADVGRAGGAASLDGAGQVPLAQIPVNLIQYNLLLQNLAEIVAVAGGIEAVISAFDNLPAIIDAPTQAAAAQESAEEAQGYALATAADRTQTGQDAASTSADRAATTADAAATSADRLQTGLDRVATGEDRTQTGQDKAATAADRVQTGLDRTQTGQDRAAAAQSALTAATVDAGAAMEANRQANGQITAFTNPNMWPDPLFRNLQFMTYTPTGTGGGVVSYLMNRGRPAMQILNATGKTVSTPAMLISDLNLVAGQPASFGMYLDSKNNATQANCVLNIEEQDLSGAVLGTTTVSSPNGTVVSGATPVFTAPQPLAIDGLVLNTSTDKVRMYWTVTGNTTVILSRPIICRGTRCDFKASVQGHAQRTVASPNLTRSLDDYNKFISGQTGVGTGAIVKKAYPSPRTPTSRSSSTTPLPVISTAPFQVTRSPLAYGSKACRSVVLFRSSSSSSLWPTRSSSIVLT